MCISDSLLPHCNCSSFVNVLVSFFQRRSLALFPCIDVHHLLVTDDRRLPLDERHSASSAGTLHFSSIAKEDSGLYKCVIVSVNGDTSEATIHLKVAGKRSHPCTFKWRVIFTSKCLLLSPPLSSLFSFSLPTSRRISPPRNC